MSTQEIQTLGQQLADAFTSKNLKAVDANEFAGKRVLVTGGTQGIGEAIVRRLAAGGSAVTTRARSPLPRGQGPALFVQADISALDGVESVVRAALDKTKSLEIRS